MSKQTAITLAGHEVALAIEQLRYSLQCPAVESARHVEAAVQRLGRVEALLKDAQPPDSEAPPAAPAHPHRRPPAK